MKRDYRRLGGLIATEMSVKIGYEEALDAIYLDARWGRYSSRQFITCRAMSDAYCPIDLLAQAEMTMAYAIAWMVLEDTK